MRRLQGEAGGDFVFPGRFADTSISDNAIDKLRVRLTSGAATTHGLRASFRTWCAERTGYAPEVAEAALAHAVRSEVQRPYTRTDYFDKRARLMTDWARYCASPPVAPAGEAIPLRA